MRKTVQSILLCTLLGAAVTAAAADRMKPGLWEMSMKSDAFKNMPQMPPEQAEQMRKMGVNVPQFKNGAMVSQVCITKEMAERDAPPLDNQEVGCKSKNYQRSGNTYSVDIVCDGQGMKGTGVARGTFSGENSFNSTYEFKGTMHGQPVNTKHETSGKWLSADCGQVKPAPAMAPKK